MVLVIKNKKYKVKTLKKFRERFCSLKFQLEPLDGVLYFPNKKYFSTTFFCQRVDLVFTTLDYHVLRIIQNVKSEKRFFYWKGRDLFVLPAFAAKPLKVGDLLYFTGDAKKEEL